MSSLIEYDAPQPLEPDYRPPGAGPTMGDFRTNLLELAWRARWLILLSLLIGVGGAWLMLQRVEPRYTSLSRIYVERSLPRILGSELQVAQSANSLYTQAELIRSTSVLALAAEAPENARLETFRDVTNRVGLLRQHLAVEVGKNDDIINVSLELPVAEDAAQLVNSVVDAYISKYAEKRRTDTVEVLNILRTEKQRRDAELAERQEALERFRSENAALAVQVGEENVITQRFAALAAELDKTELDLLDAKARYHRTQQMFETPSQRPFLLELAIARQSGDSEFRVENRGVLDLEAQIQGLELQIATEQATWGDGHPRVRLLLETQAKLEGRLERQRAAVEEAKNAVVKAYLETVAQEYQLLEQKRAELERSYDAQFQLAMQVTSQAQKLKALEDALARTVNLVEILDTRIKEVNLTEDVGAMNVSIMEVAQPSGVPSYPNRARFLGIGSLLGGLVGFGLAWLRDLLDHRLKSIDEISAALQLPVLGALPLTSERDNRSVSGKIVLAKPRSVVAEAFRTLRTAIHFGLTRDEARILVVTSPSPGDGKSTVASNLAIAMAQADQRVLLIDADMRKPRQHEIFEVANEQGLATVLTQRCPPGELIVPTELETLALLSAGPTPNNPVELLNNGFFGELLEQLAGQYDKIVIDSPPVMPVADARVIAAQADATLLVLRAERSTRRVSVAARDELWRVRAQRIGLVVNAVPGRKQASYDAGYGYGYGNYGYVYGNYGDVAYGEEEPRGNGRPRKTRALARPEKHSSEEPVEPIEL